MPCPNKQKLNLSGCDALGRDTLSQGRIPWAWKQEVPHYWPARPHGVTTLILTAVQTSKLIAHTPKYLQTGCSVFWHPTRVPSAENTFGSFPKWWYVQPFDDSFITPCWVSRYCLGQYHVDDSTETIDFKSHYVGLSLGKQIQHGHICFIMRRKLSCMQAVKQYRVSLYRILILIQLTWMNFPTLEGNLCQWNVIQTQHILIIWNQ